MTPEERIRGIERVLSSLTESIVLSHKEMEEFRERMQRFEQVQELHNAQIAENRAAIRDLIIVSRTLIESQQATDEKLHALIETVDRIVRHRDKN